MKTTLGTESAKDEQLVEWSLTGDREAFGRIVERYQSLVCSITYGATGSLTLSEDIAQETFLTAWKKLDALSDASKLRAWLCGIARNLVNNSLRRAQREPIHAAETLDSIHEPTSPEPSPSVQAVSREEEAILWRALERIPDTYREPLILFYREQQSIERVAARIGIERGRGETTAVTRTQTAGGRGRGLRRVHIATHDAGQGIHTRRAGCVAGTDPLCESGNARCDSGQR